MSLTNYRTRQLASGRWVAEKRNTFLGFFLRWLAISPCGQLYPTRTNEYKRFCICPSEEEAKRRMHILTDEEGL